MQPVTLFAGIAMAMLLSAASFAAELILPWLLNRHTAAIATVCLAALLYLGYLLHYSRLRAGKLTLAACCALLLATPAMLFESLGGTVLTAIATIWLARSLLYAPGLLPAFADLALCLLGAALAAYAAARGYGIAAAVWCFFLAQALWAAIPQRAAQRPVLQQAADAAPDRFNRAYATAEASLRRLAKHSDAL